MDRDIFFFFFDDKESEEMDSQVGNAIDDEFSEFFMESPKETSLFEISEKRVNGVSDTICSIYSERLTIKVIEES